MNKVVDIGDYLPQKKSEVICVKCGYRWVAVRPDEALLRDLECEECGPGFVVETGESIR